MPLSSSFSSSSSSLSSDSSRPARRRSIVRAEITLEAPRGGEVRAPDPGPSEIRREQRAHPTSEQAAPETEENNDNVQTWPEFLMGQRAEEPDNNEQEPRGSGASDRSSVSGRKRRITANEQDATGNERGQSRTRHDQMASPASGSPAPGPSRQVSWRRENSSGTAESSRDSPVNVSGSPQSVSRQLNSLRHRESSFTDYRLPRWQPDSEVSNCPICGGTFTFWYRKHHCRKCGRVVCSSCSPHRITIPRQFIVRSPETQRPLSTIVQSNPSATQVIALTDDGPDNNYGHSSRRRAQTHSYGPPSNPALGGGEEVRLCNPCVPDPNPEPPRRYSTLDQLIGETGSPGSRYSSYHGASHRQSASLSHPYQESQRTNRLGGRGITGLSSFLGSLDYSDSPSYRSTSSTESRHRSTYPSPRSPPGGRRYSGHSHSRSSNAYFNRTRPLPQLPVGEPYPNINEEDLCPVCNLIMPPPGRNGSDEARERHIRECIGRLSGQTHGDDSSPATPVGMVHFQATEKDCIGRDGTPQECTICMEEYQVGGQLTRLECFCKFHKACIVDWFQRKQECPVHKVA